MRELEQWLYWRSEERDGKPTKIPYCARGGASRRMASTTDPATWATFSEAVAAHRGAGDGPGGIGFVFSEEDPYCGVDLDKCRDPQTGELAPWAREIVSELDSYTEVSPSGTGVHIICKGELPPGRNRKGSVEAYQSGRYFTVTGRHIEGTPRSVEERTEGLQAVARRVFGEPGSNGNGYPQPYRGPESSLGDEELIRRASKAKGGEEFSRLWAGDATGYAHEDNEGRSEADLALCSKLAFWTGPDPGRINALFRSSGLYRQKWDKRHYGDGRTYGEGTIERALDGRTEFYTAPGARLTFGANVGVRLGPAPGAEVTENGSGHASEAGDEDPDGENVEDLSEEEIGRLLSEVEPERVCWLWTGRIPLGKLSLIDGDPGTGKSGLTGDLAARVSVGADMPDGCPGEAGGVVLLSAEDGLADTIRPRLDAAGADASKVLALATMPDSEGHERMLSIPEDLSLIERGIRRVGAKLVVVDPLMAFLSGEANSHKDQDTRKALAPLAALAERTGAAVVVVRHLNKATGGNALYRGGGSIGIIGAARSALLVAKDPQDESGARRVLAPMKSNLAAPAASLVFTLEEAESGAVRVVWQGDTDLDASRLLSTPAGREEGDAFSEAMEFLRAMLSDAPVPARQVQDEAEDAGITEATLRRAKKALNVAVYREGVEGKQGGGKWVWEIPALKPEPQDGQEGLGAQTVRDEHLNLNEGSEEDEYRIGKPDSLDAQGREGLGAQGGDEHLNRRDEHLKESASTMPESEWGEI